MSDDRKATQLIGILMNENPDVNTKMKYHYKKQINEIINGSAKNNIIFNLLKKIDQLNEDVEFEKEANIRKTETNDELKSEVKLLKKYQDNLIDEFGEKSYEYQAYTGSNL